MEKIPKNKKTKDYNLGVSLLGSLFPPIVPFTIFSDIKKAKFADHIVVNEKTLNTLKKNLSGIINQYV